MFQRFHWLLLGWFLLASSTSAWAQETLTEKEMQLVRAAERQRMDAIDQVIDSVIAVYGEDRAGGGSGVIFDPSGLALTNHHVIIGAGVSGWGGLADGELYRWELIGTDPGGDVAVIQMKGKDQWPFTPLGDSDQVKVGDWALAMGNPFVLTEDQVPTVTLGIVSGVKRYQPGAGRNQLVYGNCIQVDSSINPGNSGGPLFNMNGRVIGINGRGSFQDRGRVNVGLGYAISSNQIMNFIPDLMATKLVEHASLDANFSERGGKVVCSTLDRESPIAKAGLDLEDELLEFEGIPIKTAHQYTNLVCTLPEDWPTELLIRDKAGKEKRITVRALGLPYNTPKAPPRQQKEGESPEERRQLERQQAMVKLLSAPPGKIRKRATNKKYAKGIIQDWHELVQSESGEKELEEGKMIHFQDSVSLQKESKATQEVWVGQDGRFRIEWTQGKTTQAFVFDGMKFGRKIVSADGSTFKEMTLTEAKLSQPVVAVMGMIAGNHQDPFGMFGTTMLDGSDKAQRRNAYRMRLLDDENDWFYYWLSMYDDASNAEVRLLKASPRKDCDGDDGGVTFSDWRMIGDWSVPHQRRFIWGLEERTTATLKTESAEVLDLDGAKFELPKFESMKERSKSDKKPAESDAKEGQAKAETNTENNVENKAENGDENKAENGDENKAENGDENKAENGGENKAEKAKGPADEKTEGGGSGDDGLRANPAPVVFVGAGFLAQPQARQEKQQPVATDSETKPTKAVVEKSSSEEPMATPATGTDDSKGFFDAAITNSQPKLVKVFGAGAGRVEGFATGIIVSDEGHILTMQGVFLDGRQIRVVTLDGKEHQATILRRDRTSQLALIKIEAATPDHFQLTKDKVGQKGDWIVALSNAFKVADKTEPMSATLGIISLRTFMEARFNERDVAYKGDLIVIDSITSNPGAGGGAVVGTDGQLVGMIGKIISSSETNTRLNYCVPAMTLAKFVSGEAEAEAQAAAEVPTEKAMLGIKLFKLGGRNNPAYVDRVVKGTPAHEAGIKTDDMVIQLAGQKVGTVKDYQKVLESIRPNEEIMIILKRGRELLRKPITPEVRK